jgi:hypothetical protein
MGNHLAILGRYDTHDDHESTEISVFQSSKSFRSRGKLWPVACRLSMQEEIMLFTLAAILLIAWVLGLVGLYTVGAIFHVLLVLALVLFVVGLLSSGRAVV